MKHIIAVLISALAASSCAHVDAVARDVSACAHESSGKFAYDLEQGSAKLVADVLACDPSLSGPLLAPCVESGLANLALAIGPDGEAFVECVVARVENDPDALAVQKASARAARATLFRKPGWSRK